MGERIKRITRRVARLFKKEEPEKPRKPLVTSQIICPEQVIQEHGKRAPTTRRRRRVEPTPAREGKGHTSCVLPDGTTHVSFKNGLFATDVAVRDPVTRRLSRKRLEGGMKRTTGFYDKDGGLYDESRARW